VTVLGCFFPWAAYQPIYGTIIEYNAFFGSAWLMGLVVLCLSFSAFALMLERLLEQNWFTKKIPETTLLLAGGFQSLVLLICIGSVLSADGQHYSESVMRFGYFVCLGAQVTNFVALLLLFQNQKKQAVVDFFVRPDSGKK
jgi:hypothetical protein